MPKTEADDSAPRGLAQFTSGWWATIFPTVAAHAPSVSALLFDPPPTKPARGRRIASRCILLALYIIGALGWVEFLNRGFIDAGIYDWAWEYGFHEVIKQALTDGRVPFYVSFGYQGSNLFLAFVNISYSPQVLLLRFLSPGVYFVVNTLLLYSLGFHGCLLIRGKYRLSLVTFCYLFALMLFNGHIVAHLGIGHAQWFAYFLLPYFIYLILDITKACFSFRRALLISALLFLMILQGGVHLCAISAMFLVFLVLFNWTYNNAVRLAQVGLLSMLLSTCKILPAALYLKGEDRRFVPGFTSPLEIIQWMSTLADHLTRPAQSWGGPMEAKTYWSMFSAPWERNIYVSTAGVVFLAVCAVYLRFRPFASRTGTTFKHLDGPVAMMTFLSLDSNFLVVTVLGIPLISSVERVPSRFIILPLLTLIAIATIRYQAVLNEKAAHPWARILGVAALAHMGYMLSVHLDKWKMITLIRTTDDRMPRLRPSIIAGDNPAYEWTVVLSLAGTLAMMVVWTCLYARAQRRERSAHRSPE